MNDIYMFCFVSCFYHSSYDTFLDYFKSCKESGKMIMTLSDILQLKKDTTGNCFEFIEHFVSSLVGRIYFKITDVIIYSLNLQL